VASHYTVAKTVSTRIPRLPRLVRGAAQLPAWGRDLPPPEELWRREVGTPVTDHRTSWVRRVLTPAGQVYVKTYEYATWAARLKDFGHRTRPGTTSRAAAEFDALAWMVRHGLATASPLGVLEWRCLGFLSRATVLTAEFAGEPASTLLPRLDPGARAELASAIGVLVGRLHTLGFRDRNLDLRNLLARRDGANWSVAKIDSPRHRLRPPGDSEDRLAGADWSRLLPQLEPFGLAQLARAAAGAGAGQPPGQARSSSRI